MLMPPPILTLSPCHYAIADITPPYFAASLIIAIISPLPDYFRH
jgi:hypothetical protein